MGQIAHELFTVHTCLLTAVKHLLRVLLDFLVVNQRIVIFRGVRLTALALVSCDAGNVDTLQILSSVSIQLFRVNSE